MRLSNSLAPIIATIYECGELALKLKEKLRITSKKNGEIVSNADFEIEDLILKAIKNDFPGSFIISEESLPFEGALNMKEMEDRQIWVLDPIDGTKDYVAAGTDYAISLAQVNDKFERFACLFFPEYNDLYISVDYEGVFLNNQKIYHRSNAHELPIRIGVSLREWRNQKLLRQLFADHPEWEPVCTRSISKKIAQLIDGDIDCYFSRLFEKKRLHLWDVAPMLLMMKEWHYRVTDLDGTPCNLTQIAPLKNGIIASSEVAYKQVYPVITKTKQKFVNAIKFVE